MRPSEEAPRLTIRLPEAIKRWLAAEAARNATSQASEVVRALRERMDRVRTQHGA
jgi:hypothetical protein